MITYLRMENFRRHESTEIHFDRGTQLTLISGQNGVGKSTVVEGILYALYGEGRHGKRGLNSLVRQGAELEGMEVELRFEVDDSEYQVIRRRDGRASTAVLYGEGIPLYESPTAVTAAISQILGMDAAGFRLAVYAQQKELDGLTAQTAAARRQMVSRLLRLDVVTTARNNARAALNTTREVLAALGPAVDAAEAKARLEAAKEAQRSTAKALAATEAAIAEADAKISELAAAEKKAAELDQLRQRTEADITRLRGTIATLEAQLSALGSAPEVPEGPKTEDAQQQLTAAEAALAVAEERDAEAARAAVMARELERDRERLNEIDTALSVLARQEDVEAAGVETEKLQTEAQATKEQLEAAASGRARASGEVASLKQRLERVAELGDVCDQCGQEVDDTHRHQAKSSLQSELDTAIAQAKEAERVWQAAARAAAMAEQQLDAHLRREAELHAELNRRSVLEDERTRLHRRIKVYEQREGKKVPTVDLAAAEKAVETARAAAEAARRRDEAAAALREWQRETERISAQIADEKEALAAAEKRLGETTPSSELQRSLADLDATRQSRAAEADVAAALRVELAVAETNVTAASERLAEAEAAAERRAKTESEGATLARVADVLDTLRNRMVTEIRPALESAVSSTLDLLSEGRFPRARLTDDYDVEVDDRGVWQQLSELSGGEIDLVALAVRLGLAELIAERHGGGGIGFLILDECFGSQDPARRQAILSGIRNLRSSYGQILLISHVGGLEDHVDRVLEVTPTEDGNSADVHAA